MKNITRHENGHKKVSTINNEPSKTQQQFAEQCDINNIMKKYKQTGEITHLNKKTGIYGDFSNMPSYQEALHTVIKAEQEFMTLPADVRKKFDNNPQQFVDFINDPKNDEEAIKLGLKTQLKPTDIDHLNQNLNQLNQNLKNQTKPNPKTKSDQDPQST